jgi:hypothetical protein
MKGNARKEDKMLFTLANIRVKFLRLTSWRDVGSYAEIAGTSYQVIYQQAV